MLLHVCVGVITPEPQKVSEVLNLIDSRSGYRLCPGLLPKWYEDKVETTRVHRKNIRVFEVPFKRYESVHCLLWHEPNNRYHQLGDPLYDVCLECKKEAKRLLQNCEYAVRIDQEVKDSRRDPSSNYPVSGLSPASQAVRMKRLKRDRDINREKVSNFVEQSSKCNTCVFCHVCRLSSDPYIVVLSV